ncbi:hypothetical protein KJA15_00850 [Patescibacteria group bacterium]|nr:hypothetical protein [Patescibacteria group bacterium]
MPEEDSPEKLSNEIPKELLDLVQAEDTSLKISRICFENKIEEDEKIKEIAYQAGRVLLGDLPPGKFQEILTEKIKLSSFLARKIAREINESVFYPVKESLATLYKEEITPIEKPPARPLKVPSPPEAAPEKKPETPKKVGTYREPIE